MMEQGLILMLAGMSTVVLFLTIMVLVMMGTGSFFIRHAHRFQPQEKPQSRLERLSGDDSDVIAVLIAAVNAYVRR